MLGMADVGINQGRLGLTLVVTAGIEGVSMMTVDDVAGVWAC